MTTFALVHPDHGTHFVYDHGERDRHLKMGWTVRPADWKEAKQAADRERKIAAMKAEQERLAAEMEQMEAEPPKKRGRPAKVD